MTDAIYPQLLSEDVLQLRSQLPTKPSAVTLDGRHVRLTPLVPDRDANTLFERANGAPAQIGERSVPAYDPDEMIWRYMFGGPYPDLESFTVYLNEQCNVSNARCFCVFDQATQSQIGVVNLMNNVPEHLKIELGGIWYSPLVQRTAVNTEATYLLLDHVFGLGYRRAEWKCHSANTRSRRAALRMGFMFEGIQEAHMIVKDRNRDTAWFRILAPEWPAVKARLEELLTPR